MGWWQYYAADLFLSVPVCLLFAFFTQALPNMSQFVVFYEER